jgi:hypothetical protein
MTPRAPVRTLPAVLAALLVVCAALLVVGVALEHRSEPTRASIEPSGHEEGQHDEQGGAESNTGESETVLGVPIESPGAVAGFAAISVALAAVVWRRPGRSTAVAVAVVAAAATALDVAEVSHQLGEDHSGLAVLAAVIALGHLIIVAGAAVLWLEIKGT